MRLSSVCALAASLSISSATFQGFNYGSTKSDGSFNFQADFTSLFKASKGLVGASGFTSARLYTMIQGGSSTNEPTQAIPAAIAEDVTLLLGLWASGGPGPFSAEIDALNSAISQYGEAFTSRVIGISVGSEDLYRNSPVGQAANAGIGANANTVASYIGQVRDAIKNTGLSGVPVGHVDTWTGWVDSGSGPVIENCDFIGMDAYPYFQNTESNGIDQGKALFDAAMSVTKAAVGSKEVWITETGWPVSGATQNLAVPSIANAKTYWDQVGCPNFGTVNTFWYTLQDSNPVTPNPSFGIIGNTYTSAPLFDLSCSDVSSSSSSSSSSQSSISGSSSKATSTSGGSGSSSTKGSLSSSATSAIVSSGSGLSPAEGAGNGIGSTATTTGSTSSPTGSSSGNSTGAAPSGLTTSVSSSGSSASASPTTVSTSAANVFSSSFIAAIGAILAAVAVL